MRDTNYERSLNTGSNPLGTPRSAPGVQAGIPVAYAAALYGLGARQPGPLRPLLRHRAVPLGQKVHPGAKHPAPSTHRQVLEPLPLERAMLLVPSDSTYPDAHAPGYFYSIP